MTGGVYFYFPGVLSDGGTMLTRGSFEDLEKLGIRPKEGLRFTFYDLDADDENRPTYPCADGFLRFSEENKCWCALVGNKTFDSPLSRRIDPNPSNDQLIALMTSMTSSRSNHRSLRVAPEFQKSHSIKTPEITFPGINPTKLMAHICAPHLSDLSANTPQEIPTT